MMEKKGTEIQAPAAPKPVFLFRDIFYYDDDDSEGEDKRWKKLSSWYSLLSIFLGLVLFIDVNKDIFTIDFT